MPELFPRLWFRRFRPSNPDAATPICLPHAGGVAGTFYDLAIHLSPHVEVLSVQYPGRQDRLAETPLNNLAQLAQAIVTALPDPLHRPVALFGHSYGALLAHTIAQHLIQRGDQVRHVFLSAHDPQFAPRPNPIHQLQQEAFIAAIAQLSGPTADLLRDPIIAELSLPSLVADLEAAETYTIDETPDLSVPVFALYGQDDQRATAADLTKWNRFTSASFDLAGFDGGHLYFLNDSRSLAQYILTHLGPQNKATINPSQFKTA